MSVNLSNLPKPQAYKFMPDGDYDRFAEQQFRQLDIMAQHESIPAEWASTVLTYMASQSTIALPLEAIEMLIEIADNSIWVRDTLGNAHDSEKSVLSEIAKAYMDRTGVWLDLKSIAPPPLIADCDRVLI